MNRLEYYTRQKDSWDESEIQQIRSEYETQNLTISQMGDIHKRTPGSIAYALKRIGLVTHNTKARGYPEYHDSELYSEIISTPKVKTEKVRKEKTDESELEHQGEKWDPLEEQQLLNELEIGMNTTSIAKNHSRTTTAIRKRIRYIVYQQYTQGESTESLSKRMKLSEEEITSIIKCYVTANETKQIRKEQQKDNKKIQTTLQTVSNQPILMIAPPLQTEFTIVKTELAELKTEVLALKKMIKHISTLMESVYEFESA